MSNVSLVNGHIDRPKMTDEEVIKAWEKVLATGDAPFGEHWLCSITTGLAKETFDMLNRQKAENEKLQKENKGLKGVRLRFVAARGSKKSIISNFINYNTGFEDGAKELAERVNPIIEELVDIMFDDNHSKCMIENCHKHSSIPCESVVCIDGNKTFWKLKINNLLNEMTDNPSVRQADSSLKDGADGGVVKGKWLINPDGYYPYCSKCKEEPEGRKMTKFCPECGAYMGKP